METINKDLDLGYIISRNGTVLPIRPLIIKKSINRKGIRYTKGKKLYIHNEIIKYYILMDYIKNAEHLLNVNSFQLFCGLTDLNLSVIIRTMHELNIFIPNYVSRSQYQEICNIQANLNETIRGIAAPFLLDQQYEVETFSTLNSAIQTVNNRHKQEKEGKVK